MISQYLHEYLGGSVKVKNKRYMVDLATGQETPWDVEIFKHKQTALGSFRVELDDNGTSRGEFNPEKFVTEIITEPLENMEQVVKLNEALRYLKDKGARGVGSGQPVAIHVNIEIGGGNPGQADIDALLGFLRTYLSPRHRFELERYFKVPRNRKPYMGSYSRGMMTRILDANYQPSRRQFFDDFLYRQTMELHGKSDAWIQDIGDVKKQVRHIVESEGVDALLPVAKWNHVRISSLLVFMFPNDWISRYLVESFWVKALPIIELREANSDFRLLDLYQKVLGLFNKSLAQQPDASVEKKDGLFKRDRERLHRAEVAADGRPWVIRTMYPDGVTNPYANQTDMSYLQKYRVRQSSLVFVNGNDLPERPLSLGGESVVFHNLPELQQVLRGRYNPGLYNQFVGQFLEHKYFEALFWNDFAPRAMPETLLLRDLLTPSTSPEQLQKILNQRFPDGWVIKGAFESATQEQFIITDKHDLKVELEKYGELFEDFQRVREEALRKASGNNPDILSRLTREHPASHGWRLKRYFKQSHNAIVQERVKIATEYRVEAIAGRILGGESTVPRYQYEIPETDEWRDENEIRRVEGFTQRLLDKLPAELRATPFAFDIAVLEDGSLRMIESNPMSNSGFLIYDKRGVKALNKFLLRLPDLLKRGELSEGLSQSSQIEFVKKFTSKHRLNVPERYRYFLKELVPLREKKAVTPPAQGLRCGRVFS